MILITLHNINSTHSRVKLNLTPISHFLISFRLSNPFLWISKETFFTLKRNCRQSKNFVNNEDYLKSIEEIFITMHHPKIFYVHFGSLIKVVKRYENLKKDPWCHDQDIKCPSQYNFPSLINHYACTSEKIRS